MSTFAHLMRYFLACGIALSHTIAISSPLHAQQDLPTGSKVIAGQIAIQAQGSKNLLIDQSSTNAIIEWDGFSVGTGNKVHFNNGAGATLNRVTGSYVSKIDGHLSSTGSLYLINKNGVIIGKNGVVETGGSFIASTLDITNDDFLNGGDNIFSGTSGASIINLGRISSLGGDVAFISRKITNEGELYAPNGTVGLAVGREVLLRDAALDDGKFIVKIGETDSEIQEKGLIKAAAVELKANGGNIYALAGNRGGAINATGVTKRGGRIFLGAGPKGRVITSKKITAKRRTVGANNTNLNGGDIFINADFASIGGVLDVSGYSGGHVSIETSGTLNAAEFIDARGLQDKGGSIFIDAGGDLLSYASTIFDVSGATDGGYIRQITGKTLTTSGQYKAVGYSGTGGKIDLGGGASRLLSAYFDASGALKGGQIRIGGEYQGGKNLATDELPNTLRLAVTDSTIIKADALNSDGDGGTIILWADERATVLGTISARPGENSGQGGFIEVSAGENLSVLTSAINTAAPDGSRGGTVLLDPKNITIDNVSAVDQSIFILGKGYIYPDVTALENSDLFGSSISLDGNRLAVGAFGDDGVSNGNPDAGAVYLFTFIDSDFNGGTLAATIGKGYSGGNNIDVAALESSDQFGFSISLDGNRLAVGAISDDGVSNVNSDAGAVYLFTFTDSAFNGGSLAATLGKGYTGSNNINIAALEDSDFFGSAVSLDGNRLAVGAYFDDGVINGDTNEGAVYLFTFSDSAFNSGALAVTLGKGYTGSNNINIAALEDSDFFGSAVSLNGNRLVVGAFGDDGVSNGNSNEGAVYLFTFSDSAFNGGTLAATLGEGYTNGSNIDVTALEAGDQFGSAVSLDGNRLAVGAMGDDGVSNVNLNSGAVYLFTFTNSTFTSGAIAATLGKGYTGSNNINVVALENSDFFGSAISLDSTRLAVGAFFDDGNNNSNNITGAVYLFTFEDETFSGGTLVGTLGKGYTSGKNIDVTSLDTSDLFGVGVSLDGNRLAVGARGDAGVSNSFSQAGAVYLYTFTDDEFNGGALSAIIGKGYTGGNNIDVSALENSDNFGVAVSLDGNRLAVGAFTDSGVSNFAPGAGAVYLFTFTDSVLNGGVHEATLGWGYNSSSKDIAVPNLASGDRFGAYVSLDSNRLAVGAWGDDGAGNVNPEAGAVYLFSFADSVFNGGTTEAIIGKGYSGSKNFNVSALDTGDFFGVSVSLDGNRLAVGSLNDSGPSNATSTTGAVYLFNFTDSDFNGTSLVATLGRGYNGINDIDVTTLMAGHNFGRSVSLDGNRLAVGAWRDGGVNNNISGVGAVYLYTFTDSAFNGGALAATIGKGYSGGNNIDVTSLDAGEQFGSSVSLDGNRLAVGAELSGDVNNTLGGAGTVYLFSFTDNAFNDGSLVATLGKGYVGAKNIDVTVLDNVDQFGTSVSLDGNRLAVGAPNDDGPANTNSYTGSVYLFTFTDSAFNGGTLAATLGKGYTGGNNIDVTFIDNGDQFGFSVSLDGTRLAVGAYFDDGVIDSSGVTGAVYLFTFTDSAFNGGTLAATLGKGYTGGNNIDVTALDSSDRFGSSVSLDGTRLAVGAISDDGVSNGNDRTGAVYLFTFTDSAFNGGTLAATLGKGYTGGNNIDVTALDDVDQFGNSISLDGTRLAVGASLDDGTGNSNSNTGAIYLFTFTDSTFNGGTLATILGKGFSGGSNIDVTALDSHDRFGSSVSLDGNRLAVGVEGDDGAGNSNSFTGAVYLFTFTDSAFNGGALAATLGKGYTGGNNIDVTALDNFDFFGTSVSLDGNRLAVGVEFDDGADNTNIRAGAVYLFSNLFTDELSPVTDAVFATNPADDITITPEAITALLNAGNHVVLQANNDVSVNADILANNPSGDGGDLTILAGRSIIVDANITTDDGNLSLIGNELLANGVVDAHRDAGDAGITLAAGIGLNVGAGELLIELRDGTGKTNSDAGNIAFDGTNTITANKVSILNLGSESDNDVFFGAGTVINAANSGDAIVVSGDSFTNSAGAGLFNLTGGGRFLVYADALNSVARDGLVGNNLYNRPYATNLPASVTETGNLFIYAAQPTLTVTGVNTNVTYNGLGHTLSGFTVSGLVNGDTQDQALTTDPTFGSFVDAGPYTSGLLIGGASDIGYAINLVQGQLNINQRALIITATAADKVYDGNTVASLTFGDNRVAGDVLTIAGTGTFDDKNVGTGKTVSVTGITLDGADAGNYTFNTTTNDLADITARALTITATAADKVYDGNTVASLTFGDNRVAGDVLTIAGTGTFDDKNVGTGKTVTVTGITLGGADAGNYTFTTTTNDLADITARALTITATAADKVYDGNTVASLTFGDDRVAGDVLIIAGTGTFDDKNVGTGKTVSVTGITLGGTDAGNYTFNTTTNDLADITARALTITTTAADKVYDGNTVASLTFGDDRVAGDTLTITGTGTFDDKNVGTGKTVSVTGITLGGADAGNYTFNTTTNDLADITARALTITATAADKIYDGNTVASLTFGDDRVAGDVLTIAGTGTFDDKNVGTGKTVSVTGITLGGTDAGNYTFNTTTNDLADITARALTITATAADKVYDGNTVASLTFGDDRVAGDVLTIAGTGTFDDKNVGTGKTVSVTGITLGGTDAGNYTFNTTTNDLADITARALTITANDDSFTENGTPYSGGNGVNAFGFVTGENLADLNGTLVFSGSSQGAVVAGTYVISPSGLTSTNYNILFIDGVLIIENQELTVTEEGSNGITEFSSPRKEQTTECHYDLFDCKFIDTSLLLEQ